MDRGKPERHRVVVIGGGFGGLRTVLALKRAPVDITLIDRRNFHLFQPLLYQVATGGLSPANIAVPLRSLVRRQKNCRVILDDAIGFDLPRREVVLGNGRVGFDSLVVACGVTHSYFGHDEWEPFAPGLKTIEDATAIRRRILLAFEQAERETNRAARDRLLTFVVIGGGPTGVELAGTLIEIARHTLKQDFREIDPAEARVILIEAGERVLATFDPGLCDKALLALTRLGVDVRVKTKVVAIHQHRVEVEGPQGTEPIHAGTILWAAGVKAADLGRVLAEATGCERDRAGRLAVQADFTIPGQPGIFVIGDLAVYRQPNGSPLPGIAPAAMQAGTYVARVIRDRLAGKVPPAFQFRDRGTMATIGRAAAVADIRGWKTSGLIAWLLWLFVHLLFLVQFQNRLLVLVQWAWNYVTFNRSARLITEVGPPASETATG